MAQLNNQDFIRHYEEFISQCKAEGLFIDNTCPLTPNRLVRRILKNLGRCKSILVLYTLEFAVELFSQGHKNVTIATKDYCSMTKFFADKLGYKYYIIEEIKGMGKKFDCCVTNSPYQDAEKNPLYYKWHNMIMNDLLVNDGLAAQVTPSAMAVALETGKIKGKHSIELRKILLMDISDKLKQDFFKKVGSTFCYTIVQNTPPDGSPYTIIDNGGTYTGKLNPLKPLVSNSIVDSILHKCFEYEKNYYNYEWTTAGKLADKDTSGTGQVALNISESGSIETYNVTWNKFHKFYGKPKVFIAGFGNRAVVSYDHNIICAVEKNLVTVPTNSDAESENLVHLLECNLQKFFTIITKARGPRIDFIKHFKGVPLNKKWTDKELYAHFGLTQEEIKYIEENVK